MYYLGVEAGLWEIKLITSGQSADERTWEVHHKQFTCVCRETPACLHSSFLFLCHSPIPLLGIFFSRPPSRNDCVKRNGEDDSGNNRLITLAGLQPMRDRKEWQWSRAQGGGEALLLLLLLLHCVFKLQSAPSEGRSASDHCVGAQGPARCYSAG